MKEDYLKRFQIGHLLEEGKEGDQKQDGKKAYLEVWKNVVSEMEAWRTDFVGDWVSKDVAIRHGTTTYIHTHMHIFQRQSDYLISRPTFSDHQ
jgi:hypothetical protein